MTALDVCEPQIIRALEKDGWQILEKPHQIRVDDRDLFADFSIQHISEDGGIYAVVMEVKCFTNPRQDIPELYTAIGQYRVYRTAMNHDGYENWPLYLALPYDAYNRFADYPTLLAALIEAGVKWIIVDIVQEVVLQWVD